MNEEALEGQLERDGAGAPEVPGTNNLGAPGSGPLTWSGTHVGWAWVHCHIHLKVLPLHGGA